MRGKRHNLVFWGGCFYFAGADFEQSECFRFYLIIVHYLLNEVKTRWFRTL